MTTKCSWQDTLRPDPSGPLRDPARASGFRGTTDVALLRSLHGRGGSGPRRAYPRRRPRPTVAPPPIAPPSRGAPKTGIRRPVHRRAFFRTPSLYPKPCSGSGRARGLGPGKSGLINRKGNTNPPPPDRGAEAPPPLLPPRPTPHSALPRGPRATPGDPSPKPARPRLGRRSKRGPGRVARGRTEAGGVLRAGEGGSRRANRFKRLAAARAAGQLVAVSTLPVSARRLPSQSARLRSACSPGRVPSGSSRVACGRRRVWETPGAPRTVGREEGAQGRSGRSVERPKRRGALGLQWSGAETKGPGARRRCGRKRGPGRGPWPLATDCAPGRDEKRGAEEADERRRWLRLRKREVEVSDQGLRRSGAGRRHRGEGQARVSTLAQAGPGVVPCQAERARRDVGPSRVAARRPTARVQLFNEPSRCRNAQVSEVVLATGGGALVAIHPCGPSTRVSGCEALPSDVEGRGRGGGGRGLRPCDLPLYPSALPSSLARSLGPSGPRPARGARVARGEGS